MELAHLISLISELPCDKEMKYVRGNDFCTFQKVDVNEPRVFAKTNIGEEKTWAPSFLLDLSKKIIENKPFNISAILNNKGSFRPIIDTIIAHTKEFYWVKKGSAIETVWIPSMPKESFELEEIPLDQIPPYVETETSSASIVIKREINKSYTEDEISNILKSMYSISGASAIHVFGLKYGDILKEFNIKNILAKAGVSENYATEISKMRKVYELIKENTFNICFFEDLKLPLLDKETDLIEPNKKNLLTAMRTKPFLLLAGISGTGKSRIVKQMAFECCPETAALRSDKTSPGNYQLIEVKPNWHDSTEVLGYESEIGGKHYVVTPFVKFLVKAMCYEDKAPFFVCMDEMNLAPVEQYFAEFLSVLESRKLVDGKITSEPLIKADIFKKYGNDLKAALFDLKKAEDNIYGTATSDEAADYGSYNEVYDRLMTEGLRLPSNLIVVGTVNMDETTHQFSRKVIDRAMTIEMNIEDEETPFIDFFGKSGDLSYPQEVQPKELFLPTVVQASEAMAQLPEDDNKHLQDNIPTMLLNLNKALNGTPFKIAYRVQNELVLYYHALRKEQPDTPAEELLAKAMEAILMLKVLPRIEGDEDLLKKPLDKLAEFVAPYPEASKKVAEMQARLKQAHFASFWP